MRVVRHIEGFEERVLQALWYVKDVKGLSGSTVAERMGITRNHLYEKCNWSAWKLARFCAVTGVRSDWLLGLGGEMT